MTVYVDVTARLVHHQVQYIPSLYIAIVTVMLRYSHVRMRFFFSSCLLSSISNSSFVATREPANGEMTYLAIFIERGKRVA